MVLLIPGVLSIKIYNKLIGKKPKKDWEEFFECIFISIICYFILSILCSINIKNTPPFISFLYKQSDCLTFLYNNKINYKFMEVLFASVISMPIAYFMSYATKFIIQKNF